MSRDFGKGMAVCGVWLGIGIAVAIAGPSVDSMAFFGMIATLYIISMW